MGFALLSQVSAVETPPIESDVCVYGGTSGGIVAAVELARLGRRVELLAPGLNLGGMTTGGLASTDVGTAASIGGIAKEFYQRVGAHYGKPEAFAFEPKVATEVFAAMLREVGVIPRLNQRLSAVTKTGASLVEIRTAKGLRVRAKVFIDATYEGDLMAKSGVSFTVGRESRDVYGESLAGVYRSREIHQFEVSVDPFRHFGQWWSGMLNGIRGQELGETGAGDSSVQAYNYRMCLTKVASLARPIVRPRNYREEDYAVLGRYIAAQTAAGRSVALGDFLYFAALPGGKFDVNANGPFSTDAVGLSASYPEASAGRRTVITAQHRRWVQGVLYYLGHGAAVPQAVRSEMLQFGLCADEFPNSAGWPHQLYVREARRMSGSYVMQQGDCEGRRRAADSVALGSYPMDSHICRRVVEAGATRNEGVFYVPVAQPYRISYGAIVPRASEASNLLVTFAISASHVAFGSLRMEPVFMMLSQSAANAADLAIETGKPVQEVEYSRLAAHLIARGQILKWPVAPEGMLVVDNTEPGAVASGTWTLSSALTGFYADDYAIFLSSGSSDAGFRFARTLPGNGAYYDVFLRWTQDKNRATAVSVDVIAGDGTHTVVVDQTRNGSQWFKLGRWPFAGGKPGAVVIRTAGAKGYVVADAAGWVPAAQP